ncbi:MAG: substrate-binding domain-containing protein [Luteolibacter sp.]
MRKTFPKIAVLYPISVPWMARCLNGIRRYASEKGGWHLFCSPPTLHGAEESALTLKSMQGWKGDGIIIASTDADELREARSFEIPVVNLAAGLSPSHGIPRVMVDHFKAGEMAAEHLIEHGLRHLAFYGWEDMWYSTRRQEGFTRRAREAGISPVVLLQKARVKSSFSWQERIANLSEWLKALPRPTGIFAVHDYRAQLVMEACDEVGLRIPDDVSVIGMDDDETICEHCVPTLTSVSRNSEEVGRRAAELMDRLMQGEVSSREDILVPPDRITVRQSTDKLYSEDSIAQAALDYIRVNLRRQFSVEELAADLGISKRTLENRLRQHLRSSPRELVVKLRVQHAQHFLRNAPKCTLEQVAIECGFGTSRSFFKCFRFMTGMSPGHFRKGIREFPEESNWI